MLSYGFTELNLSKIVGFAEENNIGSLKVLEKAGLKRKANISGLSEEYSYFNGEAFFEIDKIDYLNMKKHKIVLSKWLDNNLFTITSVVSSSGKVAKVSEKENMYFLKEKGSLEDVEREIYLNTVLNEHNIQISVPIKNKDNQYYVNYDNKIYCLYNSLQGNHAVDLFSLEQAYLFGEAISRLHKGLLDCDTQKLKVFHMDIKSQLIDWAIPYSLALNENVDKIKNHLFCYLYPLLESIPVQMIHRDVHPYNILFHNNLLTGFIDWDITTIGIRIFDICYCATAILMGEFSNRENREKWFGVLKGLIKGYQSNILLDNAELQAILPVILSIQLLFIAYFKDIDPSLAKMNLEGLFWIFENRIRIEEVIGF